MEVTAAPARPGEPGARALRIVTYNVHGQSGAAIARAVTADPRLRGASLILLQEIEHHGGDALTGAADAARRLGMAHAYAPGYGIGATGSHGVAILSRFPLSEVEVIELPRYRVKFNSARRIALGATVAVGGRPALRVYSVHLDNRVNPARRIAQLEPVLERAARDRGAVIIGGDVNTSPFCWLANVVPVPCSVQGTRLERHVRARGFATPVTASGPTSPWLSMRLDAIYTRGVAVSAIGVARAVRISDHFPLWARITLPRGPSSGRPGLRPAPGRSVASAR